jgi:hypothetical protein
VPFALAAPLVASLALLANVDAEVGLRAESRTNTLAPTGLPADTRNGWLVAARSRLALEVAALRLSVSYAPRIWTSDVARRPSPVASQEATARLETYHSAPWTADAEVSATRGRTDPLADPWQSLQAAQTPQAITLSAIPFEGLRAGAGAAVPFDVRTTASARGTWWKSGGADAEARVLLPTQEGVAADLSVRHLVSVLDTLEARASGTGSTTALATGDGRSGWASLAASWRRRLTPTLDGWVGAGATSSIQDAPATPVRRSTFPVGELGVAHRGPRTSLEVRAGVEPYADRFTAEVGPLVIASCSARFQRSATLSFSARATAGARTGGDTRLATAELTGRLLLRERVALELGLVGRWQHERVPDPAPAVSAPSFKQGAAIVSLAWDSGSL